MIIVFILILSRWRNGYVIFILVITAIVILTIFINIFFRRANRYIIATMFAIHIFLFLVTFISINYKFIIFIYNSFIFSIIPYLIPFFNELAKNDEEPIPVKIFVFTRFWFSNSLASFKFVFDFKSLISLDILKLVVLCFWYSLSSLMSINWFWLSCIYVLYKTNIASFYFL